MKQNINQEQLEELNLFQIKALFDYWWDKNGIGKNELTPSEKIAFGYSSLYQLPLMSIGDMIEFLEINLPLSQFIEDSIDIECDRVVKTYFVEFRSYEDNKKFIEFDADSLCNCFWKAVKYVLNR